MLHCTVRFLVYPLSLSLRLLGGNPWDAFDSRAPRDSLVVSRWLAAIMPAQRICPLKIRGSEGIPSDMMISSDSGSSVGFPSDFCSWERRETNSTSEL
jgi:hypothetical protein